MKTMVDKTQKELLISLIEMQGKHGSDLTEIKTCLLGDEYRSEGLIEQTTANKKCIDDIKRNRLPAIEKSIEKRSGIIGGAVAFIIVAITTAVNLIVKP